MKTHRGFTVVELLVVIAVVGVLSMLTIFAFGDWRDRTARTELKNESSAISAALQSYLNFNNAYPATLAGVRYQANQNITPTYTVRTDGASYCLKLVNTALANEPWYFDSKTGSYSKTVCS